MFIYYWSLSATHPYRMNSSLPFYTYISCLKVIFFSWLKFQLNQGSCCYNHQSENDYPYRNKRLLTVYCCKQAANKQQWCGLVAAASCGIVAACEFFLCKLVLLLLVAATLRHLVAATLRLLVAAILQLLVAATLWLLVAATLRLLVAATLQLFVCRECVGLVVDCF